jgi:hypothetical protein
VAVDVPRERKKTQYNYRSLDAWYWNAPFLSLKIDSRRSPSSRLRLFYALSLQVGFAVLFCGASIAPPSFAVQDTAIRRYARLFLFGVFL